MQIRKPNENDISTNDGFTDASAGGTSALCRRGGERVVCAVSLAAHVSVACAPPLPELQKEPNERSTIREGTLLRKEAISVGFCDDSPNAAMSAEEEKLRVGDTAASSAEGLVSTTVREAALSLRG